jgi:hypothetical protein
VSVIVWWAAACAVLGSIASVLAEAWASFDDGFGVAMWLLALALAVGAAVCGYMAFDAYMTMKLAEVRP